VVRQELIHSALFEGLGSDQVEALAPLFERMDFRAGDKVFSAGDQVHHLYLLESGEVVIQFYPHDGGSLDIATIGPGGVFGWSAALGRGSYTSTALCLADSSTLAVRGEALRKVMVTDPVLGGIILERLAQVVANRFEGIRSQLVQVFQVARVA